MNQSRLKERIHYNPETGAFVWACNHRRARLGMPAGYVDGKGYLSIRIDGTLYAAHRLAWLYMTGNWPLAGFIDHRNGIPGDNRLENLRNSTKQINQENRRRASKNNQVGLLGVSPNGKRWAAAIFLHGQKTHLGTFDTPERAHIAYVHAKRLLHAGCTL